MGNGGGVGGDGGRGRGRGRGGRGRDRGVALTDAPVSGHIVVHALSRAIVSATTSSNDDSSARFDPITAREKDDTACMTRSKGKTQHGVFQWLQAVNAAAPAPAV